MAGWKAGEEVHYRAEKDYQRGGVVIGGEPALSGRRTESEEPGAIFRWH